MGALLELCQENLAHRQWHEDKEDLVYHRLSDTHRIEVFWEDADFSDRCFGKRIHVRVAGPHGITYSESGANLDRGSVRAIYAALIRKLERDVERGEMKVRSAKATLARLRGQGGASGSQS